MNARRMRKVNSRSRPDRRAELKLLARLPDAEIDTSDLPEVRNWTGAKRGLFYRPIKRQITLRIDADVVAWFKRHAPKGQGYQTNMNRALREYVRRQAYGQQGRKSGRRPRSMTAPT